MFKTETHLHTGEVSVCAHKKAAEMIKAYKNAGYSTVIVTDHFQGNTIDSYGDLPWSERMTLFLAGYYRAKKLGDEIGVNVLMGAELCFPGIPNHYLAYGITKEFLDANPNLHKMDIASFSKIAREAGVFVVQAHPYRDGKCFPTPEYIDAVEVYNANPRHLDNTELSEALVKEYSLPVSAGSDTHREEDIALSGIETEVEIKTIEQFIELVKAGKVKLIKEQK